MASKTYSLLLVDDDRQVVDSMADWLRHQGYLVTTATSHREALQQVDRRGYDLALVDIRLGDGDGFSVLAHCRKQCPQLPVILVTGYATVETGVEALRSGAFDLLTKPLIDSDLQRAIERALTERPVTDEPRPYRPITEQRVGMENIIGKDSRMLRIFDMVESIADTKATVLITGESGTGKSLVARAIHRRSMRRDFPFVEIACGALPETLLETELFGHAAGAFTGALGEKMGKFQLADRGTIFLDEIGTASPSLQVKLLRILQEFSFEPVGGNKTIRVDTRVILATNENLSKCVAEGRFRQDLFYRVNVINLEIPPLRERIADIPLLAQQFMETVCRESNKSFTGFTPDAVAALQNYAWPGNVRELQNVVERAILLGKGPVVTPDDLPQQLLVRGTPVMRPADGHSLKEALEAPERQIIIDTLKAHNWNRNQTAAVLGINRTTLYKKMKRLGLDRPETMFGGHEPG